MQPFNICDDVQGRIYYVLHSLYYCYCTNPLINHHPNHPPAVQSRPVVLHMYPSTALYCTHTQGTHNQSIVILPSQTINQPFYPIVPYHHHYHYHHHPPPYPRYPSLKPIVSTTTPPSVVTDPSHHHSWHEKNTPRSPPLSRRIWPSLSVQQPTLPRCRRLVYAPLPAIKRPTWARSVQLGWSVKLIN